MEEKDIEFVAKLPKIELHLHLDGSLSPEFIEEEAAKHGIDLPVENPCDNLRSWLQEQKLSALKKNSNRAEKGKNWGVFDFCNQFLQNDEQLKQATLDLCQRLWRKNVVYAEIRFCPELHTEKGLDADHALQSVIAGFRLQSTVLGGIIVCALRSKDSEHGVKMAELAAKYLQKSKSDPIGVVGYDVAGDEGNYPLNSLGCPMLRGIKKAQELGVPITVHAGEWPEKFDTINNLKFAINEIKADRLGHAITLRSDEEFLKSIGTKSTIEVCLTSNIGNGFKVKNYDEHPVKLFDKYEVPFTFCMDNWLLSGDLEHQPDPNQELIMGAKLLGWKSIRKALVCGAKAAFSPSIDDNWILDYTAQLAVIFDEFKKDENTV